MKDQMQNQTILIPCSKCNELCERQRHMVNQNYQPVCFNCKKRRHQERSRQLKEEGV